MHASRNRQHARSFHSPSSSRNGVATVADGADGHASSLGIDHDSAVLRPAVSCWSDPPSQDQRFLLKKLPPSRYFSHWTNRMQHSRASGVRALVPAVARALPAPATPLAIAAWQEFRPSLRTCLWVLACPGRACGCRDRVHICLSVLQQHWTRTRIPMALEKWAGLLSAFPTRRHRKARSNVAGLSSVNTAARCAARRHAASANFCVTGTQWCVGRQFAILTGFWPRKLPTNSRSSSTLPERTSPSPLLPSVSHALPHFAYRCRLHSFVRMRVRHAHAHKHTLKNRRVKLRRRTASGADSGPGDQQDGCGTRGAAPLIG